MVNINFNITDSDFDRLCEVKEQDSDSETLDISINDFAKKILTNQIHFLHYQLSQNEPEETL